MKLCEILAESGFKLPKKPKKRPNKTLWFTHSGLWKNDLNLTRPVHDLYAEENEEVIYALNPQKTSVYGFWNRKHGRGVTFAAPRPSHTIINPRNKLVKYNLL